MIVRGDATAVPGRSAFQSKTWQQHLFAGADYDGDMVNDKQLTSNIKLYSDHQAERRAAGRPLAG